MGRCSLIVALGWAFFYGVIASESTPPTETGLEESAEVRLVLLDAVVVDRNGRTVPGLGADDFEIWSRGRATAINTLDVDCADGARDDPRSVALMSRREPSLHRDDSRQMVLAFDYLHLGQAGRERAFEQALRLLDAGATAGDRVLVAALTGGLRIEQTFIDDAQSVRDAVRRMRHDVTLWNGNFQHQDETGFVRGLTALLDVLSEVPGRKSVVLFSEMRDVPLDSQFRSIAAVAAASRCALYPVDAGGLRPPASYGDFSDGVRIDSGFG